MKGKRVLIGLLRLIYLGLVGICRVIKNAWDAYQREQARKEAWRKHLTRIRQESYHGEIGRRHAISDERFDRGKRERDRKRREETPLDWLFPKKRRKKRK